MSTNKHEGSPHEYLRCSWPLEFTKRRKFSKHTENDTYIQWLKADFDNGGEDVDEVEVDDDDDDDDVDGSNDNGDSVAGLSDKSENQAENASDAIDAEAFKVYRNVRVFMKGMLGDEDTLPFRDQVEKVARFCEQESMELDLRSLVKNRKTVALLDDRNDGGTICAREGHCRPYLGPLDPQRLRKELSRQRFRVESEGNNLNAFNEEDSDAERRVIFVTNLDAPTIEALAATASRTQAPTLKNLFYKYLSNRASIGVTVPSQGFLAFALDFHIPYYVLRESDERFKDTRKKFDGTPLRQSWNFPYLSRSKSASTSVDKPLLLYEAQISIAVAGLDDWVWIAYGFIDTYFDSEESVEGYDQLNQSSWKAGAGRPDPLMAGQVTATGVPIWAPREYFLKVVKIRTFKALREWRLIVDKVENEVEQSRAHALPLSSNDPKIRQKVRSFSDWNRQMVKLLIQLISRLSDTVEAWDEFQGKEIGYFLYGSDSPNCSAPLRPLVAAIDKAFSQLRVILLKLERLRKELCEDNPQGVHAHLSLENNESAIVQRRTASHVEILTVITIVFYPLALAASLFSTQGVLPFTPSLAYFTSVLVILAALVVATLVVCSNWELWFQPMANYFMDVLSFRKPRMDDNGGLSEVDTQEATTSPIAMIQAFLPRRFRKALFRAQGDLEEGTEMEDLRES